MKHEKGCWAGFVENLVCSWEPAYKPEFKEEVCIECQVIRGELISNPNKYPCLMPNPAYSKVSSCLG